MNRRKSKKSKDVILDEQERELIQGSLFDELVESKEQSDKDPEKDKAKNKEKEKEKPEQKQPESQRVEKHCEFELTESKERKETGFNQKVSRKNRLNISLIRSRTGRFLLGLQTAILLAPATIQAEGSNTAQIDTFITFACDWLAKIGGVVALVGGVIFALGWQREDAEGKSRGLMAIMSGFMLVAISQSRAIFGL